MKMTFPARLGMSVSGLKATDNIASVGGYECVMSKDSTALLIEELGVGTLCSYVV
jgi:hypothetical protein